MTELDLLVDASSKFVSLLVDLYEKNSITTEFFRKSTRLKVDFLRDNVNNTTDIKLRELSSKILKKYNSINVCSSNFHLKVL